MRRDGSDQRCAASRIVRGTDHRPADQTGLLMPTTINLPPGQIDIPSAWRGDEMGENPDRWLIKLTADQIAELELAAMSFLATTREIGEITKDKFPLPRFGAHLAALTEKLIHGIGFEVIRGLPIAKYSQEVAAAIFCGVGAHLGS